MCIVQPLALPLGDAFLALREASEREGFRFLRRLWEETQGGIQCYDQPGECLLGVARGPVLVAVGALSHDPTGQVPTFGRVRRVYVHPHARAQGVGRRLLGALLAEARPHFAGVVLRTDTLAAARFYERLGFQPTPGAPAWSHELRFTPGPLAAA